MKTKFCTIVILIGFLPLTLFSQGLVLRNLKTQKSVEFPLNRDLEFELFSDSVLSIEYVDDGMALSYSDSSLILLDEREIEFSNFKTISIFPKSNLKAKMIASPFLMAGLGIFIKGIVMTTAEGLESKNRTLAPLYLLGGGVITGVASIPFWARKKRYDLRENKWELVIQ